MLMDRYSLLQKIGLYFCIALFLIFMLLPFFEMFMTSLRPMQHLFRSPYQFWSDEFSFDAYRKMWVTVPLLGRYILNSIGIALTVTGLTMVVVIPAAYAYARPDFPLRVVKMPEAELRNRVAKAADILQLTEKLQLKPGQLSGGQRQRVAIGRSIVRAPKVFLFDEPLSNLDAALRGDMRVELSQLQRDLAATMIHVTHDQIEAMTMAHRIVVLNAGRVEQFGTPMELYHHPATRFVATFIGQPNMNLIPAKVLGTDAAGLAVELVGGTRLILPVDPGSARAGDRVEVGLRPENVTLGAGLSLKVRVLERLGGVSITYGALPNGERFCAALPGDAQVREGETINVSINPADCHVFDAAGQVMRRRMAPALAA